MNLPPALFVLKRAVLLSLVCWTASSTCAFAEERLSLTTDDTTVEVTTQNNQPVVVALRNNISKFNWATHPSPIPLIDHVYINNESRPVHWTFLESAKQKSSHSQMLHFVSKNPDLELISIWQARPGRGPVEHHFEIINKGAQNVDIDLQPSLVLSVVPPSDHSIENWWVEKGSGTPSREGTHRETITPSYQFFQKSSPYAVDREMIPWVSIQDSTGHHGFYAGIEFSGRVSIKMQASGNPLCLNLTAGLDGSFGGYRSRLASGKRIETPTVFVGCYRGEVDDGANQLHRFVERNLRPPTKDARYPLIVNNSWGSGMSVDERLARKMIEESASLGVELFHIDAGWYRTVGDWHPNPQKFPNGLAPISDYARSKGLLFGLWIAWTQGGNSIRNMETLAATNPDQNNWFAKDHAADWKPEEFIGDPVCLASKPAHQWCLEELRRMIKEYKLDLLEHDQVMIVGDCARTNHGHTSHPVDVAYHATHGYYDIYDQIRKENPNLLFENCVNGGRMVDFGVVKRTHYISITDTYDPLSNRRAFYDSSYPLPPAMCECYIENHPGPTLATFKSMIRSGMMGWFTLMCDTSSWSPEQRAAGKRQIEIYKTWVRPLINHGSLYHISQRPEPTAWDGMEYFDAKTGKGIVFAFRGEKAKETENRFYLRGLNAKKNYTIWFEDNRETKRRVSGKELAQNGLLVELPETSTSELIYLQQE